MGMVAFILAVTALYVAVAFASLGVERSTRGPQHPGFTNLNN